VLNAHVVDLRVAAVAETLERCSAMAAYWLVGSNWPPGDYWMPVESAYLSHWRTPQSGRSGS
jgi:hypothetical protein